MITGDRNQLTEINNQAIQISFDKLNSDWLVMTFTDVTAEPAGYDTLAYWNALLDPSTLVPFQYISVVGNTISLYGGKDVCLGMVFLSGNTNLILAKTNIKRFQAIVFSGCSNLDLFCFERIDTFSSAGLKSAYLFKGADSIISTINVLYCPKQDMFSAGNFAGDFNSLNTDQEQLNANYQNSLRFSIKEGNETYIGYDRNFLFSGIPSEINTNNFLIKRITTDGHNNTIDVKWAKNDDCRYSVAWDAGAPNKYNDPSYWT